MEADRYQKNHKLFIVGIFSLLIGLSCLGFSLYMLPHLLFSWRYGSPEFIMFWKEWLQSDYGYTETIASKLIFVFLFGAAFIFLFIAYYSSSRLDRQILSKELEDTSGHVQPRNNNSREGLNLGLKILFIIILIFLVSALFQWAIYIPRI